MRRIFKNLTILLVVLAAFMMNVSCPQNGNVNSFFAVGITVDQTEPTVEISSHKNGDYMGEGDLTLSGTYEDNIGVTRVHVDMTKQGSKDVLAKEVTYDPLRKGRWSITFTEKELRDFKVFVGATKVTFSVTALDAMQNRGFASVFLYIDLDPPKIEWQR
ncbi:MAG: hypothetical protein J6Y01_05830, partial [Spirochaetales bacterium]|nr:hypothetical protein [Spirochaetales bacterium]